MRLGVIAALVLLLAGCGGDADIPAIEQEIQQGIEDQTGANVRSVDCPDQIDWKAGGEFHCFGKAQGQSFRVTVSMENDDGEWSWQVG